MLLSIRHSCIEVALRGVSTGAALRYAPATRDADVTRVGDDAALIRENTPLNPVGSGLRRCGPRRSVSHWRTRGQWQQDGWCLPVLM